MNNSSIYPEMPVHETAAAAEGDKVSPLTIHLFGPFEVRLHGRPLPRLRSRQGQWLLALLGLRHGCEVERAWLAGTVWPDSSEAAAAASLRSSLKDLRRALGSEAGRLRSPTPRTLTLDVEGAAVDVVNFDQAISQGDDTELERAVSLYRGPLLEGCVEEWALQERQSREEACLTALETLATRALSRSDPAAAERCLRRAVALDPLRESAQRGLMHALAAGGNYAAATQVYRELRLGLHRELNAAPDPETQALYQQLQAEAREKLGVRGQGSGVRKSRGQTAALASRTLPEPTPLPCPLIPDLYGTITFLFTEIEGSDQLWERYPEAMRSALDLHDAKLRQSIQAHGGLVFKTGGDAFHAAFATAPQAAAAALSAQRALLAEAWGETGPLRVLMALHTGIAEERDGTYCGPVLNRVARLLDAGHGGQVLMSLPTEELVRDELPAAASLRHLGEHRLKDLVRPEQVFQLLHPDLPETFPPLRSLAAFTHNLPIQWTSFVGREKEMEELTRLIPSTPLLTLSGAGGCGKTRLALQVAADLLEVYPDGIWLVELASLADPTLVPRTVASALGVPEEPGHPLTATLVGHLRSRSLLLVLDNCEHLLEACGQLVEAVLRACPQVRILTTSRERIGITGERVHLVPSLSLPELPPPSTGRAENVPSAMQSEAVRLLVERAVYSQPQFVLTEQNVAAVAQVCQRLDGIPLAIELAAARVTALPVGKIAERLDEMFGLLTGGSRTALPRQQTLRAALDWSYHLLFEREQRLLRRLSVFSGGWTLEAAEAVCVGDGIEDWEVLDLMTSLVDKSLIVYEEQDRGTRYRLLETVRQYSRDRLLEHEEAGAVRGRHRDHFLRLAEKGWLDSHSRIEYPRWEDDDRPALEARTDNGISGSEALTLSAPETSAECLIRERDNFRAALEWCKAESNAGEIGLRLINRLWWSWMGSQIGEAREYLMYFLSDQEEAGSLLERARALNGAGFLAHKQGDLEEARSLLEQSAALLRTLGREALVGEVLNNLGDVADSGGDFGLARAFHEGSLAIRRKNGFRWGMGWSLLHLGRLARLEGNYERAAELDHESLSLFREGGDPGPSARALLELGKVSQAQGDEAAARSCYQQGLAICRQGERLDLPLFLEAFAALAVAQGLAARAVRLYGAAGAFRDAVGWPLPPADRAHQDCSVASLRAVLGEDGLAAAWAEGRAMPLEQAIADALEEPGD